MTLLVRVVVAVIAFTAIGAAPAHAADEIQVSRDGSVWTANLTDPLFEPGFRWVPGDVETRSFFVRNAGPTGATMTVTAVKEGTSVLAEDLHFSVTIEGGPWIPLENGRASEVLDRMPVGDQAKVDVRVAFDPASTNRTETEAVPVTFTIVLSQSKFDLGGLLPDTGGPWRGLLLLGAALFGVGFAALVRLRQEVTADA